MKICARVPLWPSGQETIVCVERKTLNVRDAGCIAAAKTVFEAKESRGAASGRGAEILNCGIVVSNCHYFPIETSFCGRF